MSLKQRLYIIIFGTDTKAGKSFDIALIILILSSFIVATWASSLPSDKVLHHYLFYIEAFISILFLIEYILRVWVSPNRKEYLTSLFGIIDLLSVLPVFFLWVDDTTAHLVAVRMLRLLRVFRILRLTEFVVEENILLRALVKSSRMVMMFFSIVAIMAVIYGALMYVIEGPENGFDSIPKSIYWAIVTITTVGYGDITPHTFLGQSVAAFAMLTGYSIIAVPTGIFTASLAEQLTSKERMTESCPNCSRYGHELDAIFCRFCGASLTAREQLTEDNMRTET